MSLFKQFWKGKSGESLTEKEISEVNQRINFLQKKGWISSNIIEDLRKFNGKLSEKYRAEAAYWTEVKKKDTEKVAEIGKELGISKYKIILSPNACKLCEQKTNYGKKIFSDEEINKAGYGQSVPFHVNCFCIVVPYS
jgi:hypothetical protein